MKTAHLFTLLEIRAMYEKLIPVTLDLGMNIGPIKLSESAAALCPNKLGIFLSLFIFFEKLLHTLLFFLILQFQFLKFQAKTQKRF
jgi:hypothetical protein